MWQGIKPREVKHLAEFHNKYNTDLKHLTVKKLIELWDETDRKHEAAGIMTYELAEVRSWILDALEASDADSFNAWMEEFNCHPSKYFNT